MTYHHDDCIAAVDEDLVHVQHDLSIHKSRSGWVGKVARQPRVLVLVGVRAVLPSHRNIRLHTKPSQYEHHITTLSHNSVPAPWTCRGPPSTESIITLQNITLCNITLQCIGKVACQPRVLVLLGVRPVLSSHRNIDYKTKESR